MHVPMLSIRPPRRSSARGSKGIQSCFNVPCEVVFKFHASSECRQSALDPIRHLRPIIGRSDRCSSQIVDARTGLGLHARHPIVAGAAPGGISGIRPGAGAALRGRKGDDGDEAPSHIPMAGFVIALPVASQFFGLA